MCKPSNNPASSDGKFGDAFLPDRMSISESQKQAKQL